MVEALVGFNIPTRHIIGHTGDDLPNQSQIGPKKTLFLTSHWASTSNTNITKSNEIEASFRSPFTPSGQEMDRAYSTPSRARMRPVMKQTWQYSLEWSTGVVVSRLLNSLSSTVLSFSRECRSPICRYKHHTHRSVVVNGNITTWQFDNQSVSE